MTYSIVARCSVTGELGVAVQSHFFSVGSVVPWVEAGVGAVATQATAEVAHGPNGLAALRAGHSPADALLAVLGVDEQAASRQVGMVDATGRAAAHTGALCIEHAAHLVGDGFAAQANMMISAGVPEAMAAAFTASDAELPLRLLAALDAAQAAGGDIRGQQSAALVVVTGEAPTTPGHDRVVDVRVEDHPRPLVELRRLVALAQTYRAMEDADELMAGGDLDGALATYARSIAEQPGSVEIPFWHAVLLAGVGRIDEARAMVAAVFARPDGDRWRELVRRLPRTGSLPEAAAAALLDD